MAVPNPAQPPHTTDRLETFSDGVFAVAITLLVLGLHVSAPRGALARALGLEWPHYATYVVSFLTIGIIWMNHHAQFKRIEHADRTLMVLNLILLMIVTAIPFPTSLLATYLHDGADEQVAAAVYAGTLLAMSIAFFSGAAEAVRPLGRRAAGRLPRSPQRRRPAGIRDRDRRGLRQRVGQSRPLRRGRALLPAPGTVGRHCRLKRRGFDTSRRGVKCPADPGENRVC